MDLEGWLEDQHPDHLVQASLVAEGISSLLDCTEIQPEEMRELIISLAHYLQDGRIRCGVQHSLPE